VLYRDQVTRTPARPPRISPAEAARAILGDNRYLTLATVDADGRPWATPVWFAALDWAEFVWVSRSERRHSQTIASVPEIAIVVFDSSVAVGESAALFAEARAEEVPAADLAAALAVFNGVGAAQDLPAWTEADVTGPAPHRLYRARTTQVFVLDDDENRTPVPPPP
jgi:nitroimidazol reductase NimA-like FMN-containing flavoprotein (pyridoxamine 5'-phosphate oxidase superfamily)